MQVSVGFNFTVPRGMSISNALDALGNVAFPSLLATASVSAEFESPRTVTPQVFALEMTVTPGATSASHSVLEVASAGMEGV